MKRLNSCRLHLEGRNGRAFLLAGTCGAWLLANSACADEQNPQFGLSGFGTLGAVYHRATGQDFRRDEGTPHSAKPGQLNFQQDSMVGVQASLHANDQFEGIVQVVSRDTPDRDYRPAVTWAYLKYKPSEEFALRAGRLGIEMYLQGDSTEIGYANLMVRQPVIFYPRTMEGIDSEVRLPVGNGIFRFKGMVGRSLGTMVSDVASYDTTGSRGWGTVLEYVWGDWTVRWSSCGTTFKHEAELPSGSALFNFLATAPNGQEIVRSISMKGRKLRRDTLALAYNSGPLQGDVHLSHSSSQGWNDTNGVWATIGYRIDQFTPYVAFSRQKTNTKTLATGIPNGLSPETDAMNLFASQAQGAMRYNRSDLAVGIRHDFAPNMALKIQADHFRYLGTYETAQTRELSLLSVALEVVF